MAGVVSASFATAATAAGTGARANANAGAGAQPASPGYVQAGGAADAHMNAYGSANTNAQWQSGATRGADRTAERADMNSDGLPPSATAEPAAAGKATTQAKRSGAR
jgi:hypothetical protein